MNSDGGIASATHREIVTKLGRHGIHQFDLFYCNHRGARSLSDPPLMSVHTRKSYRERRSVFDVCAAHGLSLAPVPRASVAGLAYAYALQGDPGHDFFARCPS